MLLATFNKISGIIMIAVGVSVKSFYSDYDILLNDSYFSLPNLLIAIGSLIFFISFFGCCGAIRESWFMIFIFSILLSIIFIMEFSAGIAGYVLRDKTSSYLTDELQNSMKKYQFNPGKNDVNGETYAWDTIQENFQCCGAEGPEDWASVPKATTATGSTTKEGPSTISSTQSSTTESLATETSVTENSTVSSSTEITTATKSTEKPPTTHESDGTFKKRNVRDAAEDSKFDLPGSCCKSKPGVGGNIVCNMNNTDTATFYEKGCVEGFGDYLKAHAVTLGGVGIAIAFIQLFGVIFACHLTKQLKHGFYST
jgi:hypothetical protein